MKIAIVHLSDIHFRSCDEANPVVSRVEHIAAAVRSIASEPGIVACFVAVTGDIADSGDPREYEVALEFFSALCDALHEFSADPTKFVFVPGNHDCQLLENDSVREAIIRDSIRGAADGVDITRVEACMGAQAECFRFMSVFSRDALDDAPRLYYERNFELGNKTVSFCCFNTAWMSELEEKQGQLHFPVHLLGAEHSDRADLVVALQHHPFNWFDSNNARLFRSRVEAQADIVLTGHEHVRDRFRKDSLDGYTHEYVAGGVLQDHGTSDSGFSAVLVDFDRARHQDASWTWRSDGYRLTGDPRWISFQSGRQRSLFSNTKDFVRQLNDVGTGFTHPRKNAIVLADLFVYPDLNSISATRWKSGQTADREIVGSRSLIDDDTWSTDILIVGPDRAGKSTLARALYLGFQSKRLTPLLVEGREFRRGHNADVAKEIVRAAVAQQYGTDRVEEWDQLPRDDKVLIVDNLQNVRLNRTGQAKLLTNVRARFGHIVALAHDSFLIGELTTATPEIETFLSFSTFRLREMGHRLRGALVDRWLGLGHEYDSNERAFAHQVDGLERQIQTLLGKNLLPSYPIFVLMILQAYEARQPLNTASGSYGHYYEALIAAALHDKSKRIPLDTIYAVVSSIAYRMFTGGVAEMSPETFAQYLTDYRDAHKVSFSDDTLRAALHDARVIVWDDVGLAQFQYRYIYYYFVAKYMADNLHRSATEREIRRLVTRLVAALYVEENANVVIFFMYLTKDEETIAALRERAGSLYNDYRPCNFESDVDFVKGLIRELPDVRVIVGDTRRHREKYREALDANEEMVREEHGLDDDEDRVISETVRINEGFKTLQIIGQVLRNFPGSLSGDVKVAIAKESYLLGLRMFGFVCDLVRPNLKELQDCFIEVLREHGVQDDVVEDVAGFVVYRMMESIALGIIKRISYSIGSEYLAETFAEVVDNRVPRAISMVSLSIKLDHFEGFPTREIVELYDELHDNVFASSIIRTMAVQHLYLFPVSQRIRQQVCDRLGVKISDPRLLTGDERKFR